MLRGSTKKVFASSLSLTPWLREPMMREVIPKKAYGIAVESHVHSNTRCKDGDWKVHDSFWKKDNTKKYSGV